MLRLEIELPDGSDRFTLLVNHTKSRFGGRADNDPRRELAASRLVQALEPQIDGNKIIYVCDCNDSPDDRSANILETGDPSAAAGMEETPGPFMINLTEPLYAMGHGQPWSQDQRADAERHACGYHRPGQPPAQS